MKKLFILGLSVLLSVYTFAIDGFSHYQLDNGMTIILMEDSDAPDVFGATVTRAGSMDEPETATGLAHYLEHMLFKGTESIGTLDWGKEKPYYEQIISLYDQLAQTTDDKQRETIQLKINEASLAAAQYTATDEFSNLIQRIGGENLNAGTAFDLTMFYNSFPAYQMERWLTLYSDRLINPVFRSFQAELENVFEEYNMYQDDNQEHVQDFINERLYAGNPHARPIIGFPKDLKNPHLRELIDFFHTWYVPNNMALIMAGNFSIDEVKPLIEKTFGRLEAKELPVKPTYTPTDFSKDVRYTAKLGYTPMLCIAYDAQAARHKDNTALDFATELLSNSMNIGLLDQLTLNSKLMYAVAMNHGERDFGRLEVIGIPSMDPETQTYQSLKETESLIRAEIQNLCEGNFSNELFEAVRENMLQEYERTMESSQNLVYALITGYAYNVDIEDMLENYTSDIRSLTREQVVAMAKKYYGAPSMTFEIQEGTPKKDKLAKPKIKPLDSPKGKSEYWLAFDSIPAGKLKPVFTDLKDIDTDNFYEGVHVYCTPNPKNHIFSLRLKYGVGTYEMPLLDQAAQMMNISGIKGAPGMSPSEFRTALANVGGKVEYYATPDYFIADIEGNEANLQKIVELVNLHLLFQNFSSEGDAQLNNIKGQEYSSRQVEQSNTDIVASAASQYVQYGENSKFLRRESLENILMLTPEKLESELHRALDYELEIHYAGRLSADTVKSILYGHLPMSEHAIPSTSPVERPRVARDKQEVFFLADASMQQAKIYFYFDGDPFTNTEDVAYQAFNEYFGGGFSGLVLNEIREKRSMAYTAYGYYATPSVQGRKSNFIGYVGTQNDKVADAAKVYMSLLNDMPLNPENISSIKTILSQSLLSSKPTFRRKSERMVAWNRLGYAIDPATLQIRQVQRLKFDDIENFYHTHVQGRPVTILIMGDPKTIDQKAVKAEFGKLTKLSKNKLFK